MNKKRLPDFDKGAGLIPVVVQDVKTHAVLMLAYMNQEAYLKTLEEGEMVYFSRSRNRLWRKGESSGNTQKVVELSLDCDFDTLLAKVEQRGGAACHTGNYSCFFNKVQPDGSIEPHEQLLFDPKQVYQK